MANAEYKFPDEIDPKEQISDELDDEISIEIEDDTPPQDRNRDPLPKEVVKELEEDELEDYSTKVKKKLLQLKKWANDERREKEAYERREKEALSLAQNVVDENKKLKASLNDSQKNILESVQRSVELEMASAKKEYREAYESGDSERVLEAQEKLTTASMRADKIKNYQPAALQESDNEVKIQHQVNQAQTPRPDPTAVSWQERNNWFGKDKLMTSMALGLHEQLKDEGVAVSSQEYYRRIDETMRKRFPEQFESDTNQDEEESPRKSTKPSSVVAPATRSTSPKKIRLNQSQLTIAKKLGLTPEQYAQAALKMEA